jgi:signal transduction protein with GAF and PtsI domain
MTLMVLAGLNIVTIMAPLVVVVVIVTAWLKLNRNKSREKNLDAFEKKNFVNEDELSWYIAHDMMGAAGYADCVVYKVDATDKVCRQIAAYGPKNPDKKSILNPINIPFGRGIVGHVATTGITEKIDDTTKDARYVPDDDVRYSELTVPVLVNGKTLMIIDTEHKSASRFTAADVEFVEAVAKIAAEKLRAVRTL